MDIYFSFLAKKINIFKYTKLTPLISEMLWVVFGSFASFFVLFAGTRYLTILLSTEEFGRLALALSVSALSVQIGATPISGAIVRFYEQWLNKNKLGFLFRFALEHAVIVIILIIIASVVFALTLGNGNLIRLPQFVIVIGAFASLLVINRVAIAFEDATRKRRLRAIVQLFFEGGRFFCAIAFLMYFGKYDAETTLMGFVLAAFFIVMVQIFHLRVLYVKAVMVRPSNESNQLVDSRKTFQKYFMPLIVSNGCLWLVMMGERWALQLFGTLDDVGGYAVIHQLSFVPMMAISNIFIVAIAPIVYQYIGRGGMEKQTALVLNKNRKLAIVTAALSMFSFPLIYFLSPLLGFWLLSDNFLGYIWIFPWLFVAGGFFAASQQLLIELTAGLKTGALALLWVYVAVFALIIYALCTLWWGLQGLVYGVVVVNAVLLIISLWLSKKFARDRKYNEL